MIVKNVVKRNGTKELFVIEKVFGAIEKAFAECEKTIPSGVYDYFRSKYTSGDEIVDELSVEDIQDGIEDYLMLTYPSVAKKFIIYRYNHKVIRENKDSLIHGLTKKLMASEVQNQNANIDEFSFGGRIGEAAGLVTKDYALKYCMSKKSRNNHLNNEIYIHDLDSYAVGSHNCLSIPFDHLLENGFSTRQCGIRPASTISAALQLAAVIFQLQSLQQFGGVSATHLDHTLVPFLRKSFNKHFRNGVKYFGNNKECKKAILAIDDEYYNQFDEKIYQYALDMTKKETFQGAEAMFHNLNSLQSRSGNQLPFTSINFGTCASKEGRIIIDSLLDACLNGAGPHHTTSIFPCVIWQYMKGVNDKPGTPNYDLYLKALECTAKRIYPNYANADWTTNVNGIKRDRQWRQDIIDSLNNDQYNTLIKRLTDNPELKDILLMDVQDDEKKITVRQDVIPIEVFSTMGCRTANGQDINGLDSIKNNIMSIIESGELYDNVISSNQKDGRGNICPVTIIMPTLAMEADRDVEKFMKLLDKKIHEAKDMLIERFDWICSQSPMSASYMWNNDTMVGYIPEEGIRSAIKHGTLAIGQLGLAETLQLLIGKNQTTDEGMELAKRIESLFATRCKEFKEAYKLNFGVYYTPAENLCFTSMKKFKEKYGVIPNVSDRDYFTNSIHVPVWEELTPMEKIDIESQLTGYSSAGCITYVELDSGVKHNIEAMEKIVNHAMNKDIPYFAINVPIDTCEDCGYTDEIGECCPECGGKHITRLRRVTGYLSSSYENFNQGKQREVEHRVKHVRTIK